MNELNKSIRSTLSAGTALTALLGGSAIYHLQAPDSQALPYVVYSWQGGGQTNEVPDLRDTLEFIRAYGTSPYQAGAIDEAVAALLKPPMTVTGWYNVGLFREDDYETVENSPSGESIYTVGGVYRIILDT